MNRLLNIVAASLVMCGVIVIGYPVFSVASLTAEVLDEVPVVPGSTAVEDRHVASALWNDGFVLATRTYPPGVDEPATIDALGDDFQLGSFRESPAWAKPCCGAYDAVIVSTQTLSDGSVEQSISVYDADVQFAWLLLTAVGLILITTGTLLSRNQRPPKATPTGLLDLVAPKQHFGEERAETRTTRHPSKG